MTEEKVNDTQNQEPKPGTKDALKAENEALKAELEALRAEKENQESKPVQNAPADQDRVPLTIPRGYAKDEPFVIIAVNGVNYKLPRGKTSMVPRFVADEYHRSTRAQVVMDEHIEELLEAAK